MNPLTVWNNDKTLKIIADACGITSKSPSNLVISYTVTANIKLLSWTGWRPSVSGTKSIACPSGASSVLGNLSGALGGLSSLLG